MQIFPSALCGGDMVGLEQRGCLVTPQPGLGIGGESLPPASVPAIRAGEWGGSLVDLVLKYPDGNEKPGFAPQTAEVGSAERKIFGFTICSRRQGHGHIV